MTSSFRGVTMIMAARLLAGCAIDKPLSLAKEHRLAPMTLSCHGILAMTAFVRRGING
jgi:hypothetical protein